jgi:hypothetical protein
VKERATSLGSERRLQAALLALELPATTDERGLVASATPALATCTKGRSREVSVATSSGEG